MRRPHDVNKAFSLLVNREIARRLLSHPQLLEDVRRALAGMTEAHQSTAVARWSQLLTQPISAIAETLSRDDEDGDFVRETRPPFIALENETRVRLLREAQRLAGRGS